MTDDDRPDDSDAERVNEYAQWCAEQDAIDAANELLRGNDADE